MKDYRTLVFLKLDPARAKEKNLPVKLPLLLEDFLRASKSNEVEIDSVIRGLETALEVGEDPEYYTSYLVYAYYEKFKMCLSKAGHSHLGDCEGWLEKARKLLHDYRYHFYRAILLRKMGRLEEAELELKKASSMAPRFYPIWFELGQLYMEKGEYDDALDAFQQSMKLEPSFLPAALGVADVYAVKGLHDESIQMLEAILSADPDFLPALERLGAVYNASQRFRAAKELLERAVSISPESWEIHYNLAHALTRLGEHIRAFQHLRRAVELNPGPETLNELMLQQRNIGLFEEASDVAVKLLRHQDTPLHFRVNALKTLYYAGEWDRFWHFFDDLADQSEEALEISVLVSLETGNLKGATELFKRLRSPSAMITALMEKAKEGLYWNPVHELDVEGFVREMVDRYETSNIPKRFFEVMEGRIPEEVLDKPWNVGELIRVIYDPVPSFSSAYRNTSRLFFALFGGGNALAFGRVVYRLYQLVFTGLGFSLESFVDSVVEELKDLSWSSAVALARMVEEKTKDPEVVAESKVNDFVELMTGLLMLIAVDWDGSIEDENLREVFEEVKRWSELTDRSF
ncbi:MAG: hypothetical protein PWP37_146 [Thermotogota bacterium]|nr:hypothetical protein [Thermotogota bacterium]MDK2863954.1 hypothetical protein [Thermotogota bacterium]HCZ05825.1 hypothetical protein [Thermotogota bacterium]